MKIFAIGAELRLKKSLDIVENYMTEALEGRKEAPSDDLLSRFMKKRDIDGNLFPNTVLKRIALNFVLAGRDTSSVALSWFFWSVMTNPHVEYKILDEITTILRETRGENPKLWTEEPLAFDEADRLVYLKAALAETLRLRERYLSDWIMGKTKKIGSLQWDVIFQGSGFFTGE